jgi:hypothetical protein
LARCQKDIFSSLLTELLTAISLKEKENLAAGFRAKCPLDGKKVLKRLPDYISAQKSQDVAAQKC